MRTFLKIIFYFIIAFTLLFTALVLFSQTQIFKNWLKNKIVSEANKNLNATLSIGKIQGNLLTHFRLSDILFMASALPDTILSLPELTINFSPARLLNKEVIIKLIALDSLHFRLRQMPDSSWNVEHLVISEPDTALPVPASSQLFKWRINLKNASLVNARLDLFPLSESLIIPQRIEHINTRASLSYDRNGLKVDLYNFELKANQPDFILKKLSFALSLVKNNLNIRRLLLEISNNQFQGEGTFRFSEPASYAVTLAAMPLDFSEVQNFFPDIPIKIQSNLNLTATMENDSLRFNIDLNHQNQSLKLNGKLTSLTKNPNFQLAAVFNQINLDDWLTIPELMIRFDGELAATGEIASLEHGIVQLTGNFNNGIIFQRSFDQLTIKADYLKGDLTSDIQALGNFGHFEFNSQVTDIFNNQKFNLEGKFSHIDLSQLILDDSLRTDLNLALKATGTSFLPEKMHSIVTLDVSPTDFMGTKIDRLFSIIKIKESKFIIDTLDVESPLARLHLSGNLDLKDNNNLRFTGHLKDAGELKSLLQADSLKACGYIEGYAHGKFDSLWCEAKFELKNLLFNTIRSDAAKGDVNLMVSSDSLKLQAISQINRLSIADFPVDSVHIKADMVNNVMDLSANVFHSDSINGQIKATLLTDSLTQFIIPGIRLNLKDHVWTGGNDSMRVLLGEDDFQFHNIKLISHDQSIRLGGTFSLSGNQNLFVEVNNTDIAPFMKLLQMPLAIQGKIRMFMEMKGTAESPFIEGIVSLTDGKVNEYNFQGVDLNVSYENQQLMFIVNLNHDKTNSLVSIGSIPVNISLTTNQEILDYNKPIDINLKADGLDFSVLQAFSEQVRNVKGKILIDLNLEKTLNNPHPSGYVRLVNGELCVPDFGVNYKDIQMNFVLDTSSFSIDNFQARSDKGILTAIGKIDFNRSGLGGVIKTTNVDMTVNNFLAVNNKNYEVIVGGNVKLTGAPAAPKFGGSIRVLRSRFYIPALLQTSPQSVEEIRPILIEALRDSAEIQAEQIAQAEAASRILENLTGSIKVEIPRNTWLRSSEMNVEIAGDVELVKQSEAFELFGTIRIIRGTYDLYGKRFVIQKGSFLFDGGTEYNPEIELTANHTLRTVDRQKKTLSLEVTGKALTPKLSFTLDDNEISEGDAVSYLLLGRSLEELTHGQRSELNQQAGFSAGDQASNLVVGLVANQLSRTIGRTLNLDVIEVKGEENWQQATFVIGKYLTNDLFLRYQKEFGFRQTNELQPDEITLEYEISRRLFLQLTRGSEKTTGFDMILKFEK